jgi:cyclopropane fatty-acyl-phospholipid synthase-like methyltransferase
MARAEVKVAFARTFSGLPFSRDGKLRVLDVGCGLGFLSCFCAEFYRKALVTGFDTFEHPSLKHSSLEKAKRNAEILGFADRVTFQKGDIFQLDYTKQKFDLLVSNLVFHNLGKRRLNAYEKLAQWSAPKSHVVMADLFFDYETDHKGLSNLFGSVKEGPGRVTDGIYKMLVLSEPKR